jgi:hypothetical protein
MSLRHNTIKTMILGYKGSIYLVASTHLSLASTPRDLHDDVTCTTRSHSSTNLEARLRNSNLTYFHAKQVARSRCVSRVDLLSSVLWRNRQIEVHLVLRLKQKKRHGDFEAQIIKPEIPILRPKSENMSNLVLMSNQVIRSPCLLMHDTDHTRHHLISQSSGH